MSLDFACGSIISLFQGISVDLSTLRAEWESRSAAASAGGSLSQMNGSFGHLGNPDGSVSGSGNDVNEEIDVVGGLDSCSESGSERVDSAADGSIDGEYMPRSGELDSRRIHPGSHAHNPNGMNLNINRNLNHQQGIQRWGLSLLERRRELVSLGNAGFNSSSNNHLQEDRSADEEVQSSSIDLSVKGREERKRLNPFSIDSLLGNNRSATPAGVQSPRVNNNNNSSSNNNNNNSNSNNNNNNSNNNDNNRSSTPNNGTSSPTSPLSLPTSPRSTT